MWISRKTYKELKDENKSLKESLEHKKESLENQRAVYKDLFERSAILSNKNARLGEEIE